MSTQLTTGLRHLAAAAVALCVAMLPQRANASLGGPEAAVGAEAQQLNASIKSTDLANYRVHAIQMTSGTVLREFAVPGGAVFAVAWSGPTIPNLRQALGQYFAAYVSAAPGNRSGRSHLEIRQTGWVMQSSGHMRVFRGRAYLPQSLPAGVSLDEIH